jgi:uncharacterized protein YjdB
VDIGGDFRDGDVASVRVAPHALADTTLDATARLITLYRDVTPPQVTGARAVRVAGTTNSAVLMFTLGEVGSVYYIVLKKGDPTPSPEQVELMGTALGRQLARTFSETLTLDAAAHDIYVVAEDDEGNLSAPVRATVDAYADPAPEPGPGPSPAVPVKVASVSIQGAPKMFLYKVSHPGDRLQLRAVVLPANATNKAVTWHSGSPTFASVDRNGLVSFHAQEGVVTFTARATDGSGAYGRVTIKVARNVTSMRTVSSAKKLYIQSGKAYRLPLLMDDASVRGHTVAARVTWKSSNPKVLKVNAGGTVKASAKVRKKTRVTVTATAYNGRSLKWTVYVVPEARKLKSAAVTWPKNGVLKNGRFYTLKVRLKPAVATGVKVTFKSSKPSVVYVDKTGRLRAKKKGSAVITVKAGSRKIRKTIKVR